MNHTNHQQPNSYCCQCCPNFKWMQCQCWIIVYKCFLNLFFCANQSCSVGKSHSSSRTQTLNILLRKPVHTRHTLS